MDIKTLHSMTALIFWHWKETQILLEQVSIYSTIQLRLHTPSLLQVPGALVVTKAQY